MSKFGELKTAKKLLKVELRSFNFVKIC